ncbi:hypothetical protein HHK36_003195 [Tetracentron sinense]|uniref:Uncharacterized protein n=1 Tax=Tetracentron sinense TaxID=13715 RepID=A0A834ZSW8_TETSI|nr:hypothetical protein HHK36_003195 [Tetracentron sinense]
MGTGWRRAFCTSTSRDRETPLTEKQQRNPSPCTRSTSTKLGFLYAGNNPSMPRFLRCRTTTETASTPSSNDSPRLQCSTALTTKTSRLFQGSNPSSPRTPSKFSLFKTSLRLSKSSCGICLQSVKTGQGIAIFTAECSHTFHFPCISAHVRKHGSLVCPLCRASWKEEPLLSIHENTQQPKTQEDEEEKTRVSSLRDVKTKQEQPSDSRVYDDDEPLLSPTAGARFNPIPETDENEEDEPDDEIEEFEGFFANPSTSSIKTADEAAINSRDLRNVEVTLLPEAAVVSGGRSHETYAVILNVKAPPLAPPLRRNNTAAPLLDPARRAPIDLVTVLDVSGSMIGAKLRMLKRAMRFVISSLGSADRLSVVAFSANSKRLLPLRRMTAHGQRSTRRIIDRLVCGQGSSVGDALRKATKVLEDRRERNPVARVLLLSDGPDERISTNSITRRPSSPQVSSTGFSHLEIPVHTFGFGEHSHEATKDAFAKCVGGLLSVVVQDLQLQLGFASGSAPAEISAAYSCTGLPTMLGSGSVRLGELNAEEERELLVELKVPKSFSGAHHVMSVWCSFKDPGTQEVIYGKEQVLLVPRPHAVRSSDPKIERLRNLFVNTRAVVESRRLVEHNYLSSAHRLLSAARALLMQSSSISAQEYIRGLEAELAEIHKLRQQQQQIQHRRTSERGTANLDGNGEPLTPTSAWRAAERLAKLAIMRKSQNRVGDLHGFENARF